MVVVRPAALEDLEQIACLAGLADFGLTTLPPDREILRRRLLQARHSFASIAERPGGETYFFVLEDLDAGRIVGTSGIVSKVGGFEPFYMYQLKAMVRESPALGVRRELQVLHLIAEHDGPCEIGTLFLAPEHRGTGHGRLLSRSRFLFMAEYRQAFAPSVIAEMRGVIDAQGHSPFWEAVGRHFFGMDFPRADRLSVQDKKFIAELLPAYPVYVPLLPAQAQAAIGQVHERTRPALKILREEGFQFSGMVDIFDAGPIVTCPVDQVRTVKESARALVEELCIPRGPECIIANTPDCPQDFRACSGAIERREGRGVCIAPGTAAVLGVKAGDRVRFAPLRPGSG